MDLNNRVKNTRYNFFYKPMVLSRFIAEMIDKDQDIKRLLYYNSKQPLMNRGLGYSNEIINQADIDFSLIDDKYIVNGMFDEDIKSETKNQVYIHSFQSRGNRSGDIGTIQIAINVLVKNKFERLVNDFELRSNVIADLIADKLHKVYVDKSNASDELIEILGNLQFEVENNSFKYYRLGNSNDTVIFSFVIKTDMMVGRELKIDENL